MSAELPRQLTLPLLHELYRRRKRKPTEVARRCAERAREPESEGVFITRRPVEPLLERATQLEEFATELGDRVFERYPLFGVPYVVKDNIETAHLPVTSGCPESAYLPSQHAFVVQRLHEAGALLIGKTNMDQFATGLTGTRSPYGVPANPFDAEYIPGGSSSGSAVAIVRGYGAFSLGTDTAGSGRVPAALNDLVGYKPTRGLLSTRGVVPACRSLDCVSIFAHTVDDAERVGALAAAYDAHDPFSRQPLLEAREPERLRVGVLPETEPFPDRDMHTLYQRAKERLHRLGAEIVPIDFEPLAEAGRMLYEGPFLAERALSMETWLRQRPEAMNDTVRKVVAKGLTLSALEAFRGFHRLSELKRETEHLFCAVDLLCLPTTPTTYRVRDVLEDPIALNQKIGRYTTFVNILDLSALALPAGRRSDGLPLGISLIGRAFDDGLLFSVGRRYQVSIR